MFDRRTLLTGSLGLMIAGRLARAEAASARAKHLIVLWMAGGPSQLDTFDPKTGVDTAGPFAPIETAVRGIRISELLPRIAKQMKHVALIRSMNSAEGNHVRAAHLALTGHVPGGVKHPTIGSVVSSVTDRHASELPSFVSIGLTQFSGGFLGAEHAPFNVRNAGRLQEIMIPAVPKPRLDRRLDLLHALNRSFSEKQPGLAKDHAAVQESAVLLAGSEQKAALDLLQVPDAVKERYGDTQFGRGALVARRLIEVGVRVVQIEMGGWDTHVDNFERNKKLCADLDRGMGGLIDDLAACGKLDETLVVWMGEFGRTPKINGNQGRDHFPRAYSVALAGGGIRGGRVVGATSQNGEEIADRPVKVPELIATIYHCLGIPPDHRLGEPRGRPIDAVPDGAEPIAELI